MVSEQGPLVSRGAAVVAMVVVALLTLVAAIAVAGTELPQVGLMLAVGLILEGVIARRLVGTRAVWISLAGAAVIIFLSALLYV